MADTKKTPKYLEFEDKYAPIFAQAMIDRGVDLENLDDAKRKIFQEQFKKYVIAQMRREVNEPTKEEFEMASPQEQARILSQKESIPFGTAMERVAGRPRSVASSLYGGSNTERFGDAVSDILSGAGRTLRGGVAGLAGDNPLESMGRTPQTSDNLLGSLASDPMTPVGLGLGKAFQTTEKGLRPLLRGAGGRGIAGGSAQTLLESGERGEFVPLDRMLGNLAVNVGGETLGGLGGAGGSRLLKETGSITGPSSRGAMEALEYAKLRPQLPIDKTGLRAPFTSNQKELARVVGTEAQIGEELVDKIKNFEEFLPETKQIRPIVEQLPETEILPVIEAIENAKIKGKVLTEGALKVNQEIDNAVNSLLSQVDETGKISAIDLYDLRKMFDESIDFGRIGGNQPISQALEKGYKNARSVIKNELENLADQAGLPQYKDLMNNLSDKLKVRNQVSRWVGKSSDVADERAEGVVSNLFGKNKSERQKVMREFDAITGGDIADKAFKSKLGAQIGVEETGLPYSSEISTGKGGVLRVTPLASPLVQANVVYPMADILGGLGQTGLTTRTADILTDKPRSTLEEFFKGEGEY